MDGDDGLGPVLMATFGGGAPARVWRPKLDQRAEAAAAEVKGNVRFRSLIVAMTPADEPKRTEGRNRVLNGDLNDG